MTGPTTELLISPSKQRRVMFLRSMRYTRFAFICIIAVDMATATGRCDAEPPTIRRAEPLRFQPHVTRGVANIPDSVSFGLMCDIDGVIQTGDWKTTGTVTSHKPGLVEFTTEAFLVRGKVRDDAKPGRLAYRLPHGLTFPLSVNDPITIMHDQGANEKRAEWDIHISSGKELIFATTNQHDDTPPRSADNAEILFKDAPGGHVVFFWADPENDDRNQDLKVAGDFASAVSLKIRDDKEFKVIEASGDDPTRLSLDQTEFYFVVLSSQLLDRETNGGESHGGDSNEDADPGAADNQSHSLECFLLRAVQP